MIPASLFFLLCFECPHHVVLITEVTPYSCRWLLRIAARNQILERGGCVMGLLWMPHVESVSHGARSQEAPGLAPIGLLVLDENLGRSIEKTTQTSHRLGVSFKNNFKSYNMINYVVS